MAQLLGRPEIKLKIALELNEEEARALEAILGYDVNNFIEVFYGHMGKAYLEKYEDGLRSLFATARQPLSIWLDRVKIARQSFEAMR